MKRVYVLYALSGFVSLGYQAAWFRILVDRFGATNLTFALVVCNFIGGLGVGSLASRRFTAWLTRRAGLAPGLRVYGAVEVLVAVTVLLTLLAGWLPGDLAGTFPYVLHDGIFWPTPLYELAQVLLSAACVFVPCFFMGVTFPLLCDVFCDDDRFPSVVYGWNTLGACCGVLACEFVLLPWVGHKVALAVMVGANLGLGSYFLARGRGLQAGLPRRGRGGRKARAKPNRPVPLVYPSSVALLCACISGLIAGALEADAFKRLQFLGCRSEASMSFISFWAILAIFLAAWTVRALASLRLTWIKAAYVLAPIFYLAAWYFAYPLRDLVNAAPFSKVVESLESGGGEGPTAFLFFPFHYNLASILIYTGVFVFPAFFLVSLLLPHICNAVQMGRRHLGVVYGANTVAFLLGMAGFSWLAPRVNLFYSLKLFPLFFGALVLLLLLVRQGMAVTFWKPALVVALVGAAVSAVPTGFDASYFPADSAPARYPVRALRSNAAHTIFVVAEPRGDVLYFDSHPMSGADPGSQRYMRLMAHMPLLSQERPGEALLVCFGVGNTASAIAAHDTIERVDVVDLNEKVYETASEFASVNGNVIADRRLRLIRDDGRSFLNATDRQYDLVTSEPPPPLQQGVYRLYSKEYYESVLAHLKPTGMMTQWLPVRQMPRPAVEKAVATFIKTFPHAILFVGHDRDFILLGGKAPFDPATLERRYTASPQVVADLERLRINGPVELLARIVKGHRALLADYGEAAVISDLRNDLAYLFHDPADPAIITYDPAAVLAEVGDASLESYGDWQRVVGHLGRLKTWVEDFPELSLMSVATDGRGQVALAGVDWRRMGRLFRAAEAAAQRREWKEAVRRCRQALDVAEELPYVLGLLGNVQLATGRYEEALATWRRYQSLVPGLPNGYHGAGVTLVRLRRLDEAIASLRQALQFGPRNARTYKVLGDALAGAGRPADAVAAYDRALALDAGYDGARANRDRVVAGIAGR